MPTNPTNPEGRNSDWVLLGAAVGSMLSIAVILLVLLGRTGDLQSRVDALERAYDHQRADLDRHREALRQQQEAITLLRRAQEQSLDSLDQLDERLGDIANALGQDDE